MRSRGYPVFFESRRDIEAAVLFGSSRDGVIPDEGDVGVGILYAARPRVDDTLSLIGEISAIADHDEIEKDVAREG